MCENCEALKRCLQNETDRADRLYLDLHLTRGDLSDSRRDDRAVRPPARACDCGIGADLCRCRQEPVAMTRDLSKPWTPEHAPAMPFAKIGGDPFAGDNDVIAVEVEGQGPPVYVERPRLVDDGCSTQRLSD